MGKFRVVDTYTIKWKIKLSSKQFGYLYFQVYDSGKNFFDILQHVFQQQKNRLYKSYNIVGLEFSGKYIDELIIEGKTKVYPSVSSITESIRNILEGFSIVYQKSLEYLVDNDIIDKEKFIELYQDDQIEIKDIDIILDDNNNNELVKFLLYTIFDHKGLSLEDKDTYKYLEQFININITF